MSSDQGHGPHRIITLAFHKVHSGISYGSTNYSPGRFFRLLDLLEESGLPVRLSFDDGYAHLRDVLPGLVSRLSGPPLVFVPTVWIGKANRWDYSSFFRKEPHLSAEEIQRLAALGVEFGAHGHSHCDLAALDDDRLQSELTNSRAILEETTGTAVTSVSYPFGRHSARVLRAASEAGYVRGYTMSFPADTDKELAQGRIPVYAFDSAGVIMRRITRGRGYRWEKLKVSAITALSGGTVLLNRLRGM